MITSYVNPQRSLLYLSLVGILRKNYQGLQGYIDQLRRREAAHTYFCELQKLEHSWGARRRLSDGKPTPSIEAPELR